MTTTRLTRIRQAFWWIPAGAVIHGSLPANRGRLENYLMPRWGSVPLHRITTKAIDEWLMELDSVRSGLPLAPASLDKILTAICHILAEAKYQGHLSENPAATVEPYSTGIGRHREPFTLAEIHELFPEDIEEAIRIWQSLPWYGYFLMQWTCGLRPGEVGAFMLSRTGSRNITGQ
jgi:integrase